jgi:hypothetical protein
MLKRLPGLSNFRGNKNPIKLEAVLVLLGIAGCGPSSQSNSFIVRMFAPGLDFWTMESAAVFPLKF